MRLFVKRLKKDEGVTLIELIAALSLLALVLGMIYSVAVFGFKSYHKISVENSLRDEADILMSSIITNLYMFAPDRVIRDGADGTGILLQKDYVDSAGSNKVKERIIRIQSHALVIRDLTEAESTVSAAEAGKVAIQSRVEVDQAEVPAADRHNSVITLDDSTCRPELPCESGLINIKLVLSQEYGGETYKLTLESKFGF
ncbi:prepilin-type N-terminal cleavage/methylation domain-containing protein [Paenibacillus sp. YPG26]|uniref:prepilin-type N-terminal cleavage/methylation domain-containing protein n=1 Tax=Paenibacillus sp. YPG26 TaxID=2878915 RepID=UPI002041CA1D|nr:prepilin-type N-terminal cleavage/methylation domain-containing protein [Paenibacillus sp. YPG26]USB33677.1 prepilin-type N-terminal cleavage/methylation domain-containing protein [Paenibacillus sp. YPG26]